MPEQWTIQRTLEWCRGYLEKHGDENPRLSAEWLLSAATGLSRLNLYVNFDKPLSMEERDVLRESLKRRGQGEPLQYITGESGFRHIVVRTASGVLIPRPETELLVQAALDYFEGAQQTVRALEVGTGTGCIACSLAKEAGMEVLATDISDDAVACAKRNVSALGLDDLVEVRKTDCVEGVEGTFGLLISNPPYIPTAVMETLPHEVSGFEPHLALDGGADGLEFFDRLVNEGLALVREGGLFACELHETCLEEAQRRLVNAGLHDVRIIDDLAGKHRHIIAVV
jgi:release factor glutamine methyltransferase